TAKLVKHFASSPMTTWLSLYDDHRLGLRRAIQGSKTLQAFLHRSDLIEAIVESNKAAIDEMKSMMPESDTAQRLSTLVIAYDEILLYPRAIASFGRRIIRGAVDSVKGDTKDTPEIGNPKRR